VASGPRCAERVGEHDACSTYRHHKRSAVPMDILAVQSRACRLMDSITRLSRADFKTPTPNQESAPCARVCCPCCAGTGK